MSALKYWIWLTTREGVSRAAIRMLMEQFPTPEAVYEGDYAAYAAAGLRPKECRALGNKAMARPNQILEACDKKGIWVMTCQDADYPERLRHIYDPPCVLYGKGRRIHFDEEPAVAVVGTRKCSEYGKKAAFNLSFQLAHRGILLVSGMAWGVDAAAMRGALRAGKSVVAVLGGGIDVIYPRENADLYRALAETGLLFSEYPPGTRPEGAHFPVRNRILSGLSLGTLVVEGALRSGALITARLAGEQGRDVFAVPGNIDAPLSLGPNQLIRDGAIPVLTADDVIGEYIEQYPTKLQFSPAEHRNMIQKRDVSTGQSRAILPESTKKEVDNWETKDYIDLNTSAEPYTEDEKKILRTLQLEPMQVEELIAETGLAAGPLLGQLTVLELRGAVLQLPGKRFRRTGMLRE